MAIATLERKITYAEFRDLEFDEADRFDYELLDGEIVKKSAPSPQHQIVSGNLYIALRSFVQISKLGKVLYSPIDVFLDENSVPQPDLVYISAAKSHLITKDGIMGVPDLVIEIVSPGSLFRDRLQKLGLYAQFGVTEYWVVEPAYQSVEIYMLHDGMHQLFSSASQQGIVQSQVLGGFSVAVEHIFE